MKPPQDIIRTCAEQVLPGCFFVHGEVEAANRDADKATPTDRVVWLDDIIPFRPVVNKYGQLTHATYTCLLMLLIPSKLSDNPMQRQPRVNAMIDAAFRLVAALKGSPDVQDAVYLRGNTIFNQFDLNADGVLLVVEITPAETFDACAPLNLPA
jgi:hypothetical protein